MTRLLLITPLAFTLALSTGAAAAPEGSAAPDFTLPATDGSRVTLSDHRGKIVILEWFNPDCPFVQHAHGAGGPLRTLPGELAGDDVVWLAINSGAPGKQGAGLERNIRAREEYGIDYPVLLDEDGSVGRRYGAKTTPQMVVIDPDGQVVYNGALDTAPLGRGADGAGYVNYVAAALGDLEAGRAVVTTGTKSYGCSVKYGE